MSQNNPPIAPWFEKAIAVGLSRLAVLALPGAPIDAPSAAAMRGVWAETLWPVAAWQESADAARIAATFAALARSVDRWPAPVQFIRHLPDRPPSKRLPAPKITAAQRAAQQERLCALLATAFGKS